MSQIYFGRLDRDDGPIKIGFTSDDDAHNRLAYLQVGCPWPIVLVGSVAGEQEHERFLHRRLSRHRMRGEWFAPAPYVIETMTAVLAGRFTFPPIVPKPFSDIVRLWNTPDALAAEIGANVAAVRKWPQRNAIPAEWWASILQTKIARDAGLSAETMAKLAARSLSERAS